MLEDYRKKRSFDSTPEPAGKVTKSKNKRFVVQLHRARAKHYDFRLEHRGVLVSFAVPKGLSLSPKDKRLAVMVEDHPIDYITFEGIIPKGNYGAGTVEIFDHGTYIPLENMDKGLKNGHIKVFLEGQKLQGVWALVKMKDDNWLIIKDNDGFTGVKPQKTSGLPFKNTSVQLATLRNTLPTGKNWIYEIKYDGYRSIAYVQNGKVKILSRNGVDYTKKFDLISQNLKKIDAKNFVIDGEVVVFDENGRSDFGLLQNAIKNTPKTLVFVVFDLLALNGEDLRQNTLLKRKKRLEMLVFKAEPNILYSQHILDGKKALEFAQKHKLEGIVAKKTTSVYLGERSDDWLKIKCTNRQEFVIAGFTTTDKNEVLSAILVGYYQQNNLVFVGKVGVGFSEIDKSTLHQKFKKYIRKTSPFINEKNIKNATWVTPKFVAEIAYAELTKDLRLRQPKFLGLRTDKNPKQIKLEV